MRTGRRATPPAATATGNGDTPPADGTVSREEQLTALRSIITDEARRLDDQSLWCGSPGSESIRGVGQELELKVNITALCRKGLVAQLADWTIDTAKKPGERARVGAVLWEVTKSELTTALEKWNGGPA